jgi:hypothetical protein
MWARKDFVIIAKVIASISKYSRIDRKTTNLIISEFMLECQRQNPKFNDQKFINAIHMFQREPEKE